MHPTTKLSLSLGWLLAMCCLLTAANQLQGEGPASANQGYQLEDLGLEEALPPDPAQSPAAYLLPRLLAERIREGEGGRWQHVIDPKVYLLTETANDQDMTGVRRLKRTNGPSLSIVNPLDVLRQRLLLEIARRRMRQSEDQVIANRQWLKTIGKRSLDQQSLREMKNSSVLNHGRKWNGFLYG
uniref:CRF-related diuretic hormone 45 n=1 Tax=Nilaparvata lugens TaxID=108931 RepID=U3U7C3_NILLU|nr:CRF-related diuretic hormone 45 [Nilaparvata lugens]